MGTVKHDQIAEAIHAMFSSPNEVDSNWETANIVDVLGGLSRSAHRISLAISDDAIAGTDAMGGKVGCMVEALMGMTAALSKIADSISDVADSIREAKDHTTEAQAATVRQEG